MLSREINNAILYNMEAQLVTILVGMEVKEISRVRDHVILQFTKLKKVILAKCNHVH